MIPQSAGLSMTGLLPPSPSPSPPPPPPFPPSRRNLFQIPDLDNIEKVSMYRPGGHHPVNLGDVIHQRFKIINKLGNGGFALVWLARDLKEDRYVALKIPRSKARDNEVDVLQYIKRTAGITQITALHETFTIRGPNGLHRCLVLEFGGPSLQWVSLYCKRPLLSFRRAAARTLVEEGLAALHEVGICHGDLIDSNVLFEIKGLHDWTEDEICLYLGPPKTEPLLLLDGSPAPAFAPAHVVEALDYSRLNIEHLSGKVLITDFGEAFFQDKPPKGLGTPATFLAPELLFGYQPSCAADLWALGCLIFQIHTFHVLIPTFFGSELEALALAIETIGAIPESWQKSFFNKEISLEAEHPGEKHRWLDNQIERTRMLGPQILEDLPNLSQNQHAIFLQLLQSILVFEPSHRLPAVDVVKSPWFVQSDVQN